MNYLDKLQIKLTALRAKLRQMENEDIDKITQRRIDADMGDDYKENEGAKHVMEQHDIWYIRKVALQNEIAQLKTQIVVLKQL